MCGATPHRRASPHPTAARSGASCRRRWTRLQTARGLQGGMGWTIGKTNSRLVRVSHSKELPFLEGQRDMRPSDSAGATSPDSEGKLLAAVARTNHSSARSHRLKDFVAEIEVVEES